jgi:hypothetical protein
MDILFAIKGHRVLLSKAPLVNKYHRDISNCRNYDMQVIVRLTETGGKPVLKVDNGITGYESFYLEDLKNHKGNLFWCAGTPGEWDSLMTYAEDTEKMIRMAVSLKENYENIN